MKNELPGNILNDSGRKGAHVIEGKKNVLRPGIHSKDEGPNRRTGTFDPAQGSVP